MEKTCVVCKLPFDGRADAVTCSKKCRVALSRKGGVSVTEPPSDGAVSVTGGTDKSSDGTDNPVSVTPAMLSVTPTPMGSAVYKSVYGKEWDIMPDGYARGDDRTSAYQRMASKTPYAYFRIVMQETGFDIFHSRVTKAAFDKVDWKRLNLPGFDRIGKSVRDRLPDVDTSKAVGK